MCGSANGTGTRARTHRVLVEEERHDLRVALELLHIAAGLAGLVVDAVEDSQLRGVGALFDEPVAQRHGEADALRLVLQLQQVAHAHVHADQRVRGWLWRVGEGVPHGRHHVRGDGVREAARTAQRSQRLRDRAADQRFEPALVANRCLQATDMLGRLGGWLACSAHLRHLGQGMSEAVAHAG